MVIPAIVVAALEYFFIELGLTAKLEWLPSITWSTWPWVTNYPNFGWFMNEILELGYLIPNKAPGIVNHYCVGVLWTIPVQLQFSYTTLLGAIMVREIKSHWKRFCFYFWCISVNWYSMNWGSFFWVGLLIADLNVTYNYVAWLHPLRRRRANDDGTEYFLPILPQLETLDHTFPTYVYHLPCPWLCILVLWSLALRYSGIIGNLAVLEYLSDTVCVLLHHHRTCRHDDHAILGGRSDGIMS